jgi:hypothetical protein
MKSSSEVLPTACNQRGGVVIFVAVAMVVLIGFAALAIDLANLLVKRNELQNAADAGALAGARFLYGCDGTVNDDGFVDDCDPPLGAGGGVSVKSANEIAYDAARANRAQSTPVDVNWSGGNTGDVLRGHWSFATQTFTPRNVTTMPNLFLKTWDEVDANLDFINAVKVTTRREATSVVSYFARIFGIDSFVLSADAIAYIGFSGDAEMASYDQPIVMCRQSILNDAGEQDCRTGRLINSDSKRQESWNTGAWTDYITYDSEGSCGGSASANDVRPLVCNTGGLEGTLDLGDWLQINGGEMESALAALRRCWKEQASEDGDGGYTGGADYYAVDYSTWPNPTYTSDAQDGIPDVPWGIRVPVIVCEGNNFNTCAAYAGAVDLVVLHISGPGEDPMYLNIPRHMDGWGEGADEILTWTAEDQCHEIATLNDWIAEDDVSVNNRKLCWERFAQHFGLKDLSQDGAYADYKKKSLYVSFLCQYKQPNGNTGGEYFGVLAKIPKLVE